MALPALPSLLGGPTVASLLQGDFNRELHAKRRSDGLGTGPINPESAMTDVEVWQEQPIKKKEKIFTTYMDAGVQEVAPDRTQSRPNEGFLVFNPLPSHSKYSNPKDWALKLRVNITRGNPAVEWNDPDEADDGGGAGAQTWHMRFANNVSTFLPNKCRVLFNNTKDLNESDEMWRLRSWLTWLLNTTVEKKDSVQSQYENFCHSSTAGALINKVGRIRPYPKRPLSHDIPDQTIEARRVEEITYSLIHDNVGGANEGIDIVISPLPGPFFYSNERLPGSFTPKVELELYTGRDDLQRWIIAQHCNREEEIDNYVLPAGDDRPQVTINMDKTKLLIPYHSFDVDTALVYDKMLLEQERKPYNTEKIIRVWSSNTFTTVVNVNAEGNDLDPMPALNGQIPDQFGIGFITDGLVRGQGATYAQEKMLFYRNGIDRFQIYLGNRPVFEDGPLDWRDTPTNNQRLWQMQSDYWGKRTNKHRKNACCKDPQDHPHGQKWVWVCINPNFDGANEVIERVDEQIIIRYWADQAVPNLRCVIFIPQSVSYVCNDLVSNDWVGPEFPITPAYPEERPKVINARGGRQWT